MVLTAYCFVQFAVQVLWLGKWVMPRIMKRGGASIEKRSRALLHAHQHVSLYLKTLSRLGLVEFQFRGEVMKEPAVVVANHPSLLDFIVLLRDYPNAICLYKSQTRSNPVLSEFVKVAGYVEGMDGTRAASKRIVDECCQRLEEGHHVVFFPEGTRSKSNLSLGRFRSTGFHAAISSGLPVQPVVIYCKPLFLGKHQSWKEFSAAKNLMVIEFLKPVYVTDLPEDMRSAKALADHVRKIIKERLTELESAKSDAV
jgi:1-acyl-sn-glycerol-3-phosphate acyltransferase